MSQSVKGYLLSLFRTLKTFFLSLASEFIKLGCQKSAAALTYMTLFAIVPLLTVIYVMFSVIPASEGLSEQLQSMIFSHFIPDSGQELQGYLESFSSQAKNLTGFGIAMIVVTAYLMLRNIEKTFNAIWGVEQARRGLSSFLIYWAVLSIGPLLLAVALGVSTYVLSLKLVLNAYDTLGVAAIFYKLIPILMMSGAFTLLFVVVPNCKVPLKFGFYGGVITAICIEVLKTLFSKLVANSSIQLIYGAFAVVPLFLIWINLLWTLILSGAIVVRTLSEHRLVSSSHRGLSLVMALRCLRLFYERSKEGGKVSDDDCFRRLGLGVVQWQSLRTCLIKAQIIGELSSGGYVLSRDLTSVSLWQLADAVGLTLADFAQPVPPGVEDTWLPTYVTLQKQALEGVEGSLGESVGGVIASD